MPPLEPTELELDLSSNEDAGSSRRKSWEVTNELEGGQAFSVGAPLRTGELLDLDDEDLLPLGEPLDGARGVAQAAQRRQTFEVTSEEVPVLNDLASDDPQQRYTEALTQLYQSCARLRSSEQREALLIAALARATSFERGFLAYALPSGDWRLVTSPAGQDWPREQVLELIRLSTRLSRLSIVSNSTSNAALGCDRRPDCRLLLPLHAGAQPVGAVFLIGAVGSFDELTADFLGSFAKLATAALLGWAGQE